MLQMNLTKADDSETYRQVRACLIRRTSAGQMRHHLAIIILIAGMASGCATTPAPFTMTCAAMKMAQLTSPGKQFDIRQFSVTSPVDNKRWCLGPTGGGKFVLYTHPLMGRYIAKPERNMAANTFAMVAMMLKHEVSIFENTIALEAFIEEWISNGFSAQVTNGEMAVSSRRDDRFTLLQLDVSPAQTIDALCVRYEYKMEERYNPISEGIPLIIHDYGRICQHPTDPESIVVAAFSERYPIGNQLDPALFEQLRANTAEAFLKSLRF
jgi:hypothetical protein